MRLGENKIKKKDGDKLEINTPFPSLYFQKSKETQFGGTIRFAGLFFSSLSP